MNSLFAIYDNEITYSERLSKIIGADDLFPFEISSYSSLNNLQRDISSGIIRYVLINKETYYKTFNLNESSIFPKDLFIILLDDGTKNINNKSENLPLVWKYQSGTAIKKELLETFSSTEFTNNSTDSPSHRKNTKLISVFSVSNKEYNSSLSVLISDCLTNKGKTLCIILDAFCGFEELSYQSKDITDLLYYAASDGKNIQVKLASIVMTIDGVDYIAPPFSYLDMFSVTEDDWSKLIDILLESGIYNHIVISLSELTSGLFKILSKSSLFISIHSNKPYFEICEKHFEKIISDIGADNIIAKRLEYNFPENYSLSSSLSSIKYDKNLSDVRNMIMEVIDARL